MEWVISRNVDEVRSFMGLASYCRRFINNFSWIPYPIASLQRKGRKFEWIEECVVSFEKLKQLLTNALVLNIADPDKEFLVCTYACNGGLGGVLMWEGPVVCCESRKLNEREQNFVIHNPELAVVIHALKMCRHYLLGRRFVFMSDQNGLRYLFDQSNPNSKQDRWLAMISEFKFEIRYIKDKENMIVEAFSIRV